MPVIRKKILLPPRNVVEHPIHIRVARNTHINHSIKSGSPWRDRISLTILELHEKGVIRTLYDKWWKSPGLTCIRDEMKNKEGKANALGLDNIGGVFVVLLLGLALALITAVIEFLWNSRKITKISRVSNNTPQKQKKSQHDCHVNNGFYFFSLLFH